MAISPKKMRIDITLDKELVKTLDEVVDTLNSNPRETITWTRSQVIKLSLITFIEGAINEYNNKANAN